MYHTLTIHLLGVGHLSSFHFLTICELSSSCEYDLHSKINLMVQHTPYENSNPILHKKLNVTIHMEIQKSKRARIILNNKTVD